ncbi:MAG TPA: aldo/keto reductase [Streptosporangiaceae bacterium]|nr:aldo/keto reductase [Streptosporangiaceae bacterium]
MKYRVIGTDPATRRSVSVLSLGAMLMGTRTDEQTSFAILDRFVSAGGNFIDTSGNYAFWVNGTQGGESEELLGRWRRSRGVSDSVVIATKVGARPLAPSAGFAGAVMEGLSAKVLRESAARSMARLGVSRLDLMYAHIEDPSVPAEETVGAFGELVASGEVGLLGVSNHWSWRVERARSAALRLGVPGYEVLQYHYSYLRPRADLPGRLSAYGSAGVAQGDLLDMVRFSPGLTLVAYSPLLSGAYVRPDRPLGAEFSHAGTAARLSVLRSVAEETGATVNQAVLAWLMGGEIPVIPLVGASSVAQLEESLAAVDLELSAAQRERLDQAH